MDLLINKPAFETWKSGNIFDGDEAAIPAEFPCYVTKEVLNWNCEYEKAIYFYKSDIEKMLDNLM